MKSANLSIIMPNYNHAHYLPRALDAILRQSVPPKEVIVVDDASTDDSVRVVERVAARNPIIRLIRNERNRASTAPPNAASPCPPAATLYSARPTISFCPALFKSRWTCLTAIPKPGWPVPYCSTIDGTTGGFTRTRSGLCATPGFLPPGGSRT